jgi:hypothetical protein
VQSGKPSGGAPGNPDLNDICVAFFKIFRIPGQQMDAAIRGPWGIFLIGPLACDEIIETSC